MVTMATSEAAEPPAEDDLPDRRRRHPREVERAGADLGAEHGVADDQGGDRHGEAEDALGGDVGERPLGRVVDRRGRGARTGGRRRRRRARPPTPRRDARPQRVATIDERPGPRSRVGGTAAHRTSSRNRLSSESSRARTSSRRTPASRASRGGRGELAGPHGLDDEPVAVAVERDARHRVERRRAPRPAGAGASARTSTWRGRSSMASRMARWSPAAASRPWTRTITRSASRSTSLRTCELTMTVRPSAPSRRNRAIRRPAARGRRR